MRLMIGASASGRLCSIGWNAGDRKKVDRLHAGEAEQGDAHRHQADVDDQPLRDPASVTVEEQDAHHRAQPGRAHDEEEVSGRSPRMSVANPGPMAPITPIRLEAMPR